MKRSLLPWLLALVVLTQADGRSVYLAVSNVVGAFPDTEQCPPQAKANIRLVNGIVCVRETAEEAAAKIGKAE